MPERDLAAAALCSGSAKKPTQLPIAWACFVYVAVISALQTGSLLTSGCAFAAVLTVEPFSLVDYSLGPLEGQNPLPKQNGYSWGWGIFQDQGITSRSAVGSTLSYVDSNLNSLAVSGGSIEISAQQSGSTIGLTTSNRALDIDGTFAPFSSAGTLIDQGTVYLSFLLQTTQFSGAHGSYLKLSAGSAEALRIGSRDNAGFIVGQGNSSQTVIAFDDASTHLFLAKLNMNASGNDNVTVWMDPDLGLTSDPVGGTFFFGVEMSFNGITLEELTVSSSSLLIDELRFGAEIGDVLPIAAPATQASVSAPEPSSVFLAIVAFFGIVFLRVGQSHFAWLMGNNNHKIF